MKKGTPQPLHEFVETSDGWRLATYRYLPSKPRRYPVLLIHGLGTNRFNIDFPERRLSLAQYLSERNFDTWVIELRGAGRSHTKGLIQKYVTKYRTGWTFDDYVFKDLPALVSHIQKRTGKERLHWVGHSLGGTLVYAAIETLGNEVCASAVTLGAAMSSHAKPGFIRLLLRLDRLYKMLPFLPLKQFAKKFSSLARWVVPLEDNFYYSSDNIDLRTIEIGLKTAVEDISTTLFLQLHRWYRDNHFCAANGFHYFKNLKKIRAPFFICAGSVDGLTPEPDVQMAYQMISSQNKKFRVFGRESGCRTDYAHIDLVLGKNAPREVFPEIGDWLIRNDRKDATS